VGTFRICTIVFDMKKDYFHLIFMSTRLALKAAPKPLVVSSNSLNYSWGS
jgi:hypothetical protein